jgi:pimeloyl-ACP methyl ester carboxylesterase
MPEFEFVHLRTNGITLRAVVQGEGPLVVLVHGFPESWHAWRHQIPALAGLGFRVCAIDLRGYGGSDKPYPVEAYDLQTMIADIVGVVQNLGGGEPGVLIGHDWGAYLVWHTALVRPDVIHAVAGLSVPFVGVGERPLIDLAKLIYTDNGKFFYQVYFQPVGVAEAAFEADVQGFVRRFYYWLSGEAAGLGIGEHKPAGATMLDGLPDPDPFPSWMSAADIDYLVGEFQAGGLRGPLNRYRNQHRDHAFLQGFKGEPIKQPSLYIGGTNDIVLSMIPGFDLLAAMKSLTPGLKASVLLDGCGHWTQQERPEEVTRLLGDWLLGLDFNTDREQTHAV